MPSAVCYIEVWGRNRSRVASVLVFSGRVFEDHRLLVAFTFSFGLDAIVANLQQDVSRLRPSTQVALYLQDVLLHI